MFTHWTGLDTKVKINMILGEQFTAELRQKVIDAFMLKKKIVARKRVCTTD